jgi:hypothetical protein
MFPKNYEQKQNYSILSFCRTDNPFYNQTHIDNKNRPDSGGNLLLAMVKAFIAFLL